MCICLYESGSWKGFLITRVNRHPFPLTSPYSCILSSVSSAPRFGSFLLVLNINTLFIPPILSSRPTEEIVRHSHICMHALSHINAHSHKHSSKILCIVIALDHIFTNPGYRLERWKLCVCPFVCIMQCGCVQSGPQVSVDIYIYVCICVCVCQLVS